MPKVIHVKKAQKDIPEYGIKKGESYYHWKFRYGGKRCSKTYPKRSQLTQSDFLGRLYELEDRLGELGAISSPDELKDEVKSIVSDLSDLRDEQEEKKNNMPDSLQESPTGELLQERYDGLEEMINELEGIDLDYEEPDEDGLKEEAIQALYGVDDEDDVPMDQYDQSEVDAKIEELRVENAEEWVAEKSEEACNVSYNGG